MPRSEKVLPYVLNTIGWGALLFIIFQLILAGYSVSWTGFGSYPSPNGEVAREKTLWDWMGLLLVPLFLAGGAFYLNSSERRSEREVATDRQQEQALQAYIDRISELLLKEKLRTTKIPDVQTVAATRTLTVLRGLDATRKGFVLRFLYEAGLISKDKTIVSLEGADLRGINLSLIRLTDANLRKLDLSGANFTRTDLRGTDLEQADLSCARLREARLFAANLYRANLQDADLSGANMRFDKTTDEGRAGQKTDLFAANTQGTDFSNAHMEDAEFTPQQLRYVKSYKGAIMPGGGHFPENYDFDKD